MSSRRAAFGGQLTGEEGSASSDTPTMVTTASPPPGLTSPPPGLSLPEGKGSGGGKKKLTAAAAAPNPEAPTSGESDCFLCAEPARYWALGECAHRTCDVCAVRMRALYKKTECAFCKVSPDTLS